MKKDNSIYYEQFDWEKAGLSEKVKDKVEKLFEIIPVEVQSIVDIGCGDGSISNALAAKYKVLAIDRSLNALEYVKVSKIQGSADKIPLTDNIVDLVFSSEMIEHLPEQIFEGAIEEFKRLSRKYILLTFPDDENIDKLNTKCLKCGLVFNKSYHLRRLNKKNVSDLLAEYKIITTFYFGKPKRYYNKVLSYLKHKCTPASAWIPKWWTPDNRRSTMCPGCNHQFEIPYKFNLLATILDLLNIIISRKRPYQICILFEAKNAR